MLRRFAVWLTRSLVILLVASLIFSFLSFNIPEMVNGLFADVFTYASPEAQNETITKLAGTCSSLQKGGKVFSVGEICTNASLLASMKENCDNYKVLKAKGIPIENEQQILQTCEEIESGELEEACSGNSGFLPDLNKLGELCNSYGEGRISERQFFAGVLASPFGGQQVSLPHVAFLDEYHKTMDYLSTHKILYFLLIASLVLALYFLLWDMELFVAVLASMCFSIGLLILIPYAAVLLYDVFIGIDTTPILTTIFGSGAIKPSSIVSVIMLLFLRTYNTFIIILGIILLGIGMAGKGYRILVIDKKK